MITEYTHYGLVVWNYVMTIGSVLGLAVLETGILDGIFMIWDRIVHGTPFLEA